MTIEAFESAIQPQGRFAAIFERDDDTAYFYLVDLNHPQGNQVIDAFWLADVVTMPNDITVRVAWTPDGNMAGLLVEGRLVAVFDMMTIRGDACEGREPGPLERGRFLDG